jgi:hypothetical protein
MRSEHAPGTPSGRLGDLIRFYAILDGLEERIGGRGTLRGLPRAYGEAAARRLFLHGGRPTLNRLDSAEGLRIVRIGTRARWLA